MDNAGGNGLVAINDTGAKLDGYYAVYATHVGLLAVLLLPVVLAAAYYGKRGKLDPAKGGETALRGPFVMPVFGALYKMIGYRERPFRRFTQMARDYGAVYSLPLGAVPCVVVNDLASIKEVLYANGSKFGGRPDFIRYKVLFGGDRNNSLALCDWSTLQETRRKIARLYCAPKLCSVNYDLMDSIASKELEVFLESLSAAVSANNGLVQVKPLLLMSCANSFLQYMCSKKFDYNDLGFQEMVRAFDEIFFDINYGYPLDFLPWLKPFYWKHLENLDKWAKYVREFLTKTVLAERNAYIRAMALERGEVPNLNYEDDDNDIQEQEPKDFTDSLLMNLLKEPELTLENVQYQLEDFIGGHSAIGNMTMLGLSMVALFPDVARKIRQEAVQVTGGKRSVRLTDKPDMTYTQATIYETLRIVSSPIVPHVASEDAVIKGHKIKKGTCIMINNFDLNTNPEKWTNPEKFEPSRFIHCKPGGKPYISKPDYFLPFGTGKRSCIGQKLVNGFGFVLLAGIIQKYDVKAADKITIPESRLALRPDTYPLIFVPLNESQLPNLT